MYFKGAYQSFIERLLLGLMRASLEFALGTNAKVLMSLRVLISHVTKQGVLCSITKIKELFGPLLLLVP